MVVVVALVLSSCARVAAVDVSDEDVVRQYLSWGDSESQDSMQRRYHSAVQDALTECMALRGFDYVPVSPEASGYGPGTGISREDFAARFGFGIATSDAYFAAAMEIAAADGPNDAYVLSLAQEERNSYGEVFVSCMETVGQDITPPPSFIQEVRRLEDAVRRTPEAIKAQEAWAKCMVLKNEFASVRSLEELTSLLQAEYQDSKDTPSVLTDLQQLEINMAVRNLECEKELNSKLAVIAADLERNFIDKNREQIADQRAILGG